MVSFPFFSVTALARPSSSRMNKAGEAGCLCLVLDLRRKALAFFPLSVMLVVGLSYVTLNMLKYGLSMAALLCFHKWMLNFVKPSFCVC